MPAKLTKTQKTERANLYRSEVAAQMGAVASGNSYAPAAFRAVADSIMRKLEITGGNFLDLCCKYNDHGYTPTLRGDLDPLYTVLADCYDFEQARRGSPARAYRG